MSIVEGAAAHVPEGWFEVRGARFRGVVEGDPSSTLADECRAAADVDGLLDALTAGGVRRTPAFAVVADGSGDEPARAMARGGAYVAWSGPESGRVTAPARGPWSDEDLPDAVTGLEVRGPETAPPTAPPSGDVPVAVPPGGSSGGSAGWWTAGSPADADAGQPAPEAEPTPAEAPTGHAGPVEPVPVGSVTDESGHAPPTELPPVEPVVEAPVAPPAEDTDTDPVAGQVVLEPTQAMSLDEVEAARADAEAQPTGAAAAEGAEDDVVETGDAAAGDAGADAGAVHADPRAGAGEGTQADAAEHDASQAEADQDEDAILQKAQPEEAQEPAGPVGAARGGAAAPAPSTGVGPEHAADAEAGSTAGPDADIRGDGDAGPDADIRGDGDTGPDAGGVDPDADQAHLSMDAPADPSSVPAPAPTAEPTGPWGAPGSGQRLGGQVPEQGVPIAELTPQVGVAELPAQAALIGSHEDRPQAPAGSARAGIADVPFHRAVGLEPPAGPSAPAPAPAPAAAQPSPFAPPPAPPAPATPPATSAPPAPPVPPGPGETSPHTPYPAHRSTPVGGAAAPPSYAPPPQAPPQAGPPQQAGPTPYPPPPPPHAASQPAAPQQPPPGSGQQPTGRTALSVRCPAGHLGPPYEASCRTCGQDIPAQQPFAVPQPTVGVLRLSTGEVVTLDRDVLLGRNPRPEGDPALPRHLVRVPSPEKDVSRTHLEVSLEGWHVIARDLGSTNGTTLATPGQPPSRMRPHEEQVLRPGSVLVMAGEVSVTFEAAAPH